MTRFELEDVQHQLSVKSLGKQNSYLQARTTSVVLGSLLAYCLVGSGQILLRDEENARGYIHGSIYKNISATLLL